MKAKKEMIAMLLAGGRGSRLGVLTANMAKPAVSFGGKYRIIDFPLSNCVNSGIDTVGVLTQYMPFRLNTHVGIGIPWDLDKNVGGVSILSPYEQLRNTEWYTGTANAVLQNISFIESYDPDYVLILSGDHIYKMDYEAMLDYHKECGAQVTIAVMPVPYEDAGRFGIMITDGYGRITDFEEKPENPCSNLASMGIYIFNWKTLREALLAGKDEPDLDFGRHVIPFCRENGALLCAYEFNGYWKDVGTLSSYWEANMELIDIVPEFNLYEEFWKIYTRSDSVMPQYFGSASAVNRAVIGEGTRVFGTVSNSVIGCNVVIGEGAVIRDSIIMNNTVIGSGAVLDRAIVAENVTVGPGTVIGEGEEKPNVYQPDVYCGGLVTIGEDTVIPDGVRIGRNAVISGVTVREDYPEGALGSGAALIKEGTAQ